MPEWCKGWVAPSIIVALLAYGFGGVSWLNNIGHVGQSNARDIERLDRRITSLEAKGGTDGARMAIVETQLAAVVEMLKRIEARMDRDAGRG